MITTDIAGVDATRRSEFSASPRRWRSHDRLGRDPICRQPLDPDQLAGDQRPASATSRRSNQALGIKGGIQNHSGQDYFAAPVSDAVQIFKASSAGVGIAFDIGHATLEGGLSWPDPGGLAEPE